MMRNIKVSEKGVLLSQLLKENNIYLEMPCSGNGTCGKCKVKVSGQLTAISKREELLLTEHEIGEGYRLACFARVLSDISVEANIIKHNQIISEGFVPSYEFNPIIDKNEYAIAIDIGTTTVVICLLKGDSNMPINKISEMNKQKIYGADVISRINYSIENSACEVHNIIVNQINDMILKLLLEVNIDKSDIKYAVITGNTTMLHFFEGLDPGDMAYFPFKVKSLFGYHIENTMNLNISSDGIIYLPPCIDAFVGADLITAIYASNMTIKNKKALIVDIGTNGEMALFKNGKLKCCSVAAGPAFEGASIKYGSSSVEGAICKVYFDANDQAVRFETINDKTPISICGSGIVDAVSVFLDLGIIDRSGRIMDEGHDFIRNICLCYDEICFKFDDCDVYITQKDIRQIQLAKAAVEAGIYTILNETDTDLGELEEFYICGGFGTFLNLDSAANIGLIPENLSLKAIILGNAALTGAYLAILDKQSIEKIEEIFKKCEYIELSSSTFFMDKYINAMSF